jgi:hypothetical protein
VRFNILGVSSENLHPYLLLTCACACSCLPATCYACILAGCADQGSAPVRSHAEQAQLSRDALTLRRVHRKLVLKQSVALMQRPGAFGVLSAL